MTENVFTSMSSEKMAHLIGMASEQVIIAMPGIREKAATTLIELPLGSALSTSQSSWIATKSYSDLAN